jgi:hypothetical protein
MTNLALTERLRELIMDIGKCCGCTSASKDAADKAVALVEEMWKADHREGDCACSLGVTCRAIDHG